MIRAEFSGAVIPKERYNMLWSLIKEEGWSRDRLLRTIKWFLKHRQSFAKEWKISDFFNYNCKTYGHTWYLAQVEGNADANKNIEKWKLDDGSVVFKYADGVELPYEYLGRCDGSQ